MAALTLLLGLILTPQAGTKPHKHGAAWEYIGWSEGFSYYYWPKSIRSVPDHRRRIWIKQVPDTPPPENAYTVLLDECDCVERRSRTIARTTYDGSGRATESHTEVRGKWDTQFQKALAKGRWSWRVAKPRTDGREKESKGFARRLCL